MKPSGGSATTTTTTEQLGGAAASGMTPEECRRRFASAPVGHLATANAVAEPHVVPFVFALEPSSDPAHPDRIYTAVDHKPKRTNALRRLANIAENPAVAAMVDHYEDDWDRLWWVRADGSGRLIESGSPEGRRAIELLQARYRPYEQLPPVARCSPSTSGAGQAGPPPNRDE